MKTALHRSLHQNIKVHILYSVSYDAEELKHIITEINASMLHNTRVSAFVIKVCEVKEAIEKLKLHKSDGGFMLSSDHFLNAGFDLSIDRYFISIYCYYFSWIGA